MSRYEISYEEYSKIINGLSNALLSRKIIDRNKKAQRYEIKYDTVKIKKLIAEIEGLIGLTEK